MYWKKLFFWKISPGHWVSRDESMKDQGSKFQSYNRLPADGETGFGQKKGVRVFWWNKLYTLRQIKCDMFFWNRFVSLQPVVDNPPKKGATKKIFKQKFWNSRNWTFFVSCNFWIKPIVLEILTGLETQILTKIPEIKVLNRQKLNNFC